MYVSQRNLDRIADLAAELTAIQDLDKIRTKLRELAGPGHEEEQPLTIIEHLRVQALAVKILEGRKAETARQDLAEVHHILSEVSSVPSTSARARAVIDAWRALRGYWDTPTAQAAQRGEHITMMGKVYVPASESRPQVFTQGDIPAHVMRVRSVEDHTETFTRKVDGLYKGLWSGDQSGGYYNTSELLALTDVEAC